MTLSSQVNTTLHQGITSELISANMLWGRTISLRYKASEEESLIFVRPKARSRWRTCMIQSEELSLYLLLLNQDWAEHRCPFARSLWGGMSEQHRWSGRQADCTAQGLRDWNGEPAWLMSPHLDGSGVGVSYRPHRGSAGIFGLGGYSKG